MNNIQIHTKSESVYPVSQDPLIMTKAHKKSIQKSHSSVSVKPLKKTKSDRSIPLIDLSNFSRRRAEISEQLWDAATNYGFFQLVNHGIPTKDIDFAFIQANRFFDLPESEKAQFPLRKSKNAGWESRKQVRSSTGLADQKESYQIVHPRMKGLWPKESQLPGFKRQLLAFENSCWFLSMQLMSCFAEKLGLDKDFFTQTHNPEQSDYQSTLRLLHYYASAEKDSSESASEPAQRPQQWWAGAHTDYDCLTLLFQRNQQRGLEVCCDQTKETQTWSPVIPDEGLITCNIGDMLMRWSDDKLRSTLHRVAMPKGSRNFDDRHSMAFFCQANSRQTIYGPEGKYPPISAREYLRQRIATNSAIRSPI
jgi:isopenicillin N synthase-like dioxygenase